MFTTTKIAAAVATGLLAGLTALAPVASADPVNPGPQVSTAQAHPTTPISGISGAPLGDTTFGTSPLIPFGTEPMSKVTLGYVDRNHDEGNTANGTVDAPF